MKQLHGVYEGFDGRQRVLAMAGATVCAVSALAIVVLLLLLLFVDPAAVIVDGGGGAASGRSGAVAADVADCSAMGVSVLRDLGGNAVDAAVTTCLCLGLINAHSSGVGGGGVMLVRSPAGLADLYDFREVAPDAASQDMFVADPMASRNGPLAVAVPGELAGLEAAHRAHGRLPWADVVTPVAVLAEAGFPAPAHLVHALNSARDQVLADPGLRAVYAPNGDLLQVGDIVRRSKFAETLRRVARNGAAEFYLRNYTTASGWVGDLRALGGIVTADDVERYYNNGGVVRRAPIDTFFMGYEVLTSPPPFGGVVMALTLNIIERFRLDLLQRGSPLTWHWIIEALKFAYGDRMALGDPAFQPANFSTIVDLMQDKHHSQALRSRLMPDRTHPFEYYQDLGPPLAPAEDHGTTHFSVVDSDRMVVACTSTINLYFGSKIMSLSTGVILNDEMDDFSTPNVSNAFNLPPSESNFIRPRKRPQSSMTPTVVLRDGAPALVVGGSGGSLIITGTMQVLLNTIVFGMTVEDAVAAARIHDQLIPPVAQVEEAMGDDIVEWLQDVGHNVTVVPHVDCAVQAIFLSEDGLLHAASDPRKGGASAAYTESN